MILFHDIVQVRTSTTAAPTAKSALPLQFGHNLGIRRIAVHVDHPRARVTRSEQGGLEEALGGSGITTGGKQEIDGGAGGIDGPVQVGPFAFHPDVGLVDSLGAVGGLQFPTTALIQFGRIALDPSPDGGVVCGQASFGEQFLDVPVRQGKPQIPADRTGGHRRLEVAPLNKGGLGFRIPAGYQDALASHPQLCNTTL